MTLKHWIWILSGLLVWAVIAVLWMTGPYDCTSPDPVHHRVHCKQ